MNFRLDTILEQWAQVYTPLSHDPDPLKKHRTFYRVGMIDQNSEFVRNFQTCASPAMAYATHIDAEMSKQSPKAISYRHVVYFMVKQAAGSLSKTLATDEEGAADARFQTDGMVQDLLAYLFTLRSLVGGKRPSADQMQVIEHIFQGTPQFDPATRNGINGLRLEEAHWGTLPVMFAGWHICGLTIEQLQSRDLCIVPSRYRLDG
jgi:hypothetical protein